ncbi:hypothetical protein O6H91_18G048600 [Diphasiastrum complanatum]|uniref:Uncharacterized protein n=1 Tax=Diphasiastrum complanatum TaxID=34168 RepID=A0ACC2B0R0_DIPCM|nr:hypothetical protein O6H91_18G048600 [Diphasiastrum complanatum]
MDCLALRSAASSLCLEDVLCSQGQLRLAEHLHDGKLRRNALTSQVLRTNGRISACKASSNQDAEVTLLDYGAGNVRSVRNAIHLMGFQIKDVNKPEDIENANRLILPGVGSFAAAMAKLEEKCFFLTQVKKVVTLKKPSKILAGVKRNHVYFVHSYRAVPLVENEDWVLATTVYGEEFLAAVSKGNVYATQFHPEKSGVVGLDIVRRFLDGGRSCEAEEISRVAETSSMRSGSTLAKRVIACLDVRSNDMGDLVVTKGDQYDVREQSGDQEVRNLGKPVDLASRYYEDGADEVTFLNITGFRDSPLGDIPMLEVLRSTSKRVFVPLTVGGGIRDFKDKDGRYYSSLEVASEYFRSGADKISIGTDAVYAAEEYLKTGKKTGTSSLEQISSVYGKQAVIVSVDPRRIYIKGPNDVPFKTIKVQTTGPNDEEYAWYQCMVKGGREGRPIGAFELAKAVEDLGAGEILLNCIDCDGQGNGYDLDLIKLVSEAVTIPVIASSGAGSIHHFSEVFLQTPASAALAAGIFHRKEVPIMSVKEHMMKAGIETRI